MIKYLAARVLQDDPAERHKPILHTIRRVEKFLTQKSGNECHVGKTKSREELVHELSRAVTWVWEWNVIDALKADEFFTPAWKPDPSIDLNVHAVSAAAFLGDKALVEGYLLHQGSSAVNCRSDFFGRPLRAAASEHHDDLVEFLLKRGADVNIERPSSGYSVEHRITGWGPSNAVQAAARAGHESTLQLLLKPEYRVERAGSEFQKAIFEAACGGHDKIMEWLMKIGGYTSPCLFHEWILVQVCINGHVQIVRILLDMGVSPDLDWMPMESALSMAAEYRHLEIVRMMLEHGARPDYCATGSSNTSFTPLNKAAKRGNMEMCQLLLSYGADIHGGWPTAVGQAITHRHAELFKFLLANGADLERPNNGSTAFSDLMDEGFEEIRSILRNTEAFVKRRIPDITPDQYRLVAEMP